MEWVRYPLVQKGWLKKRFWGILKRATVTTAVYPRFLEFLHVGIQSTLGAHCHDLGHDSRMTSCLKQSAQNCTVELF